MNITDARFFADGVAYLDDVEAELYRLGWQPASDYDASRGQNNRPVIRLTLSAEHDHHGECIELEAGSGQPMCYVLPEAPLKISPRGYAMLLDRAARTELERRRQLRGQ